MYIVSASSSLNCSIFLANSAHISLTNQFTNEYIFYLTNPTTFPAYNLNYCKVKILMFYSFHLPYIINIQYMYPLPDSNYIHYFEYLRMLQLQLQILEIIADNNNERNSNFRQRTLHWIKLSMSIICSSEYILQIPLQRNDRAGFTLYSDFIIMSISCRLTSL